MAKEDLPQFVNASASIDSEGKGVRLIGVSADLERGRIGRSADLKLWSYIRQSVAGLSYPQYEAFVDFVLRQQQIQRPSPGTKSSSHQLAYDDLAERSDDVSTPFLGVDQYRLLKAATDVFLMMRVGSLPDTSALRGGRPKVDPADPLPNRSDDLDADALKVVAGASESDGTYDDFDVAAATRSPLTESGMLPYLEAVLDNLGIRRELRPITDENRKDRETAEGGIERFRRTLRNKLARPMFLELIWSYWHEEGMLVQTMNAISLRFQNRRQPNGRDILAGMTLDPLRNMSNLLWGYVQDEQHRLTIARRAYEYDHHYGLRLEGRAVPPLQPVDSRSQFIGAFHELLYRVCQFYREDDNTIVKADPFPVLNALKDLHVVLSEGAHNQYGDLPWTARGEMLQQMYLLARPEIKEFLGGRPSVAYPQPWMDRVDTVKKLQGWTDVSVIQYYDLARFGEVLLLSIRFTKWLDVMLPSEAATWARIHRAEVQGYVHAYHAVTGVDLSAETTSVQDKALRDVLPSVLMRQRLQEEIAQRGGNPQIGSAAAPQALPAGGNGTANVTRSLGVRRGLPLPPRLGPARQ